MRRRAFIAGVGSAVAWPLAARAQQRSPARKLGLLIPFPPGDEEIKARVAALLEALHGLGWTEGRRLQVVYRWQAGDADLYRRFAAELLADSPDVLLATTTPALIALLQATKTVPIVFVQVIDPLGAALVTGISHPGGNATGFTQFEYGLSGKWLELVKEVAPEISRVAVLMDSTLISGTKQLEAIETSARRLQVEITPVDAREPAALERGIIEFARGPNGGLITVSNPAVGGNRALIIALAAQHRLPAVYPYRYMAMEGGLLAYGPDTIEPYRRAAEYIDRILRGESPAGLPIQSPTKYELTVNLKTAKALGLQVPPTLLARADEVIE
jgi:putative ABC transport system substrate-binding protein